VHHDPAPHLLFLCTGNAVRSVMAGAMLQAHPAPGGAELFVTTAGTHVNEHQPMGIRTRDALRAVGLDPPVHRSRQLTESDVRAAHLVVAMAAEHVSYVRRRHPEGADRTATVRYLVGRLRAGPEPLEQRVAQLHLAGVDPAGQGDVVDPAGGDDEDYLACARDLVALMGALVPLL